MTARQTYTFLIRFRGGETRTVTRAGLDEMDARELVLLHLSDLDKERVVAVVAEIPKEAS
ncbi:hypothetical protein ACQ858_08260 [Variovorax ureilyticus]|uniref:hypothetical protein n=1 Tax=Variovorax ureilyticus TaxID=1836198 RepID=UPI003D66F2EC